MAGSSLASLRGMDAFYAGILQGVGVPSSASLLAEGATPDDRRRLAEVTGIPEDLIASWVTQVDLTRIKGVAGEYARLLEAVGIRSTRDLAGQRSSTLHATMASVNAARRIVKTLPSRSDVLNWITHARSLP